VKDSRIRNTFLLFIQPAMLQLLNKGLATATLLFFAAFVMAQSAPMVLPLWEKGAPGYEARRLEPEQAKEYWIKNIHNPTITVYLPPKEKRTGAAVIICPGGGHRLLVYGSEGAAPAAYLNRLGVAAIVLKYRLARDSASPYSLERHPREDGQRALRLVRSHAKEWGIDTARVGMLGFSAGGEVVALTAFSKQDSTRPADAVDRWDGQPDFLMFVYPGPLGFTDSVAATAPPAFMIAANNDACCSEPVVRLLQAYRKAGAPIEVHLYAQGSHAFNMGNRSKLASIQRWPQRMADWMQDNNILQPSPAGWKPE
jgi:acetyl esterase/lipase